MCISYYLLGKKKGGGSATLQNKSVTITQNGSQTITADTGYDGLSGVAVTTNVPTGADTEQLKNMVERKNNTYITINVPSGTTQVGECAFYKFYGLKKVNLPSGIISIGQEAFNECTGLTEINFPEGMTTLGQQALYKCYSIKEFKMPSTLTNIGALAFGFCRGAKKFDFTACVQVPTAAGGIFTNTYSTQKIVVPDALYDDWIVANNWSQYSSQIVKASEYTE